MEQAGPVSVNLILYSVTLLRYISCILDNCICRHDTPPFSARGRATPSARRDANRSVSVRFNGPPP
jgi:hypothetical protein